jgi:hypothetical protein
VIVLMTTLMLPSSPVCGWAGLPQPRSSKAWAADTRAVSDVLFLAMPANVWMLSSVCDLAKLLKSAGALVIWPGGVPPCRTSALETIAWSSYSSARRLLATPMTRSELATGLSIFLMVAAAGIASTTYVNRYFAVAEASENAESAPPNAPPCVDENGSWKNWSWPNVPVLSPKC